MDAVVAAATPPGRAALALVRLTGRDAIVVFGAVAALRTTSLLSDRRPRRVDLVDGDVVYDDGVAVLFAGPRSATGEDLIEITCHGNDHIVRRLIACALRAGARAADAGEFTRRALVNGRIDLAGAEAVLLIAEATTDAGLSVARAGLDGRLAEAVTRLRSPLVDAAADLEARLDWPDDELATVPDDALIDGLRAASDATRALAATCDVGRVLVSGARVALVGTVNAGKSSLFNALLGRPRAIVHESPGTTRDVIEASFDLEGVHVTLLDTAGERATGDPVEAAGLALARELVADVDVIVVVLRARSGTDPVEQEILERTSARRRLVVYNGVDREGVDAAPSGAIATSARSGEGLQVLRSALRERLIGQPSVEEVVRIASTRQRDHLLAAAGCLDEACEDVGTAGVAVAADAVTRAIRELDAIVGLDAGKDVLDSLFARFCIGK